MGERGTLPPLGSRRGKCDARVEWWGEEVCGIRACVAAQEFERASGVAGECADIEGGRKGSRRARCMLPRRPRGEGMREDHAAGSNQEAGNRAGAGSNRALLTAA